MKKAIAVLLAVALILSFAACGKTETETDPNAVLSGVDVNVGVLKGPTGIGAVYLMDKAEREETINNYDFSVTSDPTDVVAKLTNGSLDIAALPTNTAANLYNKTSGGVQIIAINTLGVMYVLENGNTVNSVSDLKGKTIYSNGQGANPEYTLNFILRQNGLEPGTDVDVQYRDASEIATLMASGEAEICMLPVPYTTTLLMKNENLRVALDMNAAYSEAANDGSILTMGCLVARTDFINEHRDAVDAFLAEYNESIEYVTGNAYEAAELVAKYEITASAEIAEAAIPDCGIVCITGGDMQPSIEGYFKVLYDAEASSVGGKLPDADFYYVQ